jgi:AraC-like DNA-binding protein
MITNTVFDELPPAYRIDYRNRESYLAVANGIYGRIWSDFEVTKEAFHHTGHVVDMGNVAVTHTVTTIGHVLRTETIAGYTQSFLISGSAKASFGRAEGRVDIRHAAIANTGEAYSLGRSGNSELFSMRMKPEPLNSKLAALLGKDAPVRCTFDSESSMEASPMMHMLRTVAFLMEAWSGLDGPARHLVCGELQQAVTVSFLFANRHNYSDALARPGKDPAPWQVRMAEQYVEANWEEPLTIENLVAVTGTSARSLFEAFQKHRGYSPMVFVKRIRLRKAREILTSGGSASSVTNVAYSCGFGNLGHFASAYRSTFGERPSETLAKARTAKRVGGSVRQRAES